MDKGDVEKLTEAINSVGDAISDAFGSPSELTMVDAIYALARSIDRLGNADASTPMGGLEALGKVLSDSIDGLASTVENNGT